MLSYAEERETEEAVRPLWIAHYAIKKLNGEDPVSYEDLLHSLLSDDCSAEIKREERTPESIEAEFLSIVEADRRKEGK